MAYDKVVDSSVLDNNLLSIADAIREKAGLEESFAFPAGFVEAIAGIEAGNFNGYKNMYMGTFTPAETITGQNNSITIETDIPYSEISNPEKLGALFFNGSYKENGAYSDFKGSILVSIRMNFSPTYKTTKALIYKTDGTYNLGSSLIGGDLVLSDNLEEDDTINLTVHSGTGGGFLAGLTYYWLIFERE